MQPLSAQQIDDYLSSAGEEFAALRIAIRDDSHLRDLASTPLILSVLILAYQRRSVNDLVTTPPTEQRQQLFTIYVQRMLQRRGAKTRYTTQQTIRWLAWMAWLTADYYQPEFYELLPSNWQPMNQSNSLSERIIAGLFNGLVFTLCCGLIFGLRKELSIGLALGLAFGLVSGLLNITFYRLLPMNLIFGLHTEPIDKLLSKWNITGLMLSKLASGLVCGLVIGLCSGLVSGSIYGLLFGMSRGLLFGLVNGSLFGLIGGLISGWNRCIDGLLILLFLWHAAHIPQLIDRFWRIW